MNFYYFYYVGVRHANRFLTLHYANNDRHKSALSSVTQRKSKLADNMKQITNGMKPTRDDMRFLVYPDSVMLGWGCFERIR
ncbi:hypothetical protein T11_12796 [Trichinella zimbabwensis]|uniref:Uncharacterized protein n=1 Tax=Trichinella zimbabwensis TaxID=268475 RepID=A0A0V1HSY4_9BILA|nr:hypothetical protein T11_12796 [Trichinella zimbabwensis]